MPGAESLSDGVDLAAVGAYDAGTNGTLGQRAQGGQTTITDEALACGPHNRLANPAAGKPENLRTAASRAAFYLVNGGIAGR